MASVKPTSVVVGLALLIPQAAHAQNNSFNTSSLNSTNASSAQSAQSSQASLIGSAIVLGAGLLAGVGGGITTTMYRRDERARRLAQPPPPAQQPPPTMEPVPFPDPNATPPPPPPPLSSATESKPTIEAMIEARWWLLANEVQLKQDLALGAGPALDDLAGLARIAPERRAHFARLLQKNRALFLLPREATPEQAARMMSRVGELVLADPILRIDGEAVLAVL